MKKFMELMNFGRTKSHECVEYDRIEVPESILKFSQKIKTIFELLRKAALYHIKETEDFKQISFAEKSAIIKINNQEYKFYVNFALCPQPWGLVDGTLCHTIFSINNVNKENDNFKISIYMDKIKYSGTILIPNAVKIFNEIYNKFLNIQNKIDIAEIEQELKLDRMKLQEKEQELKGQEFLQYIKE